MSMVQLPSVDRLPSMPAATRKGAVQVDSRLDNLQQHPTVVKRGGEHAYICAVRIRAGVLQVDQIARHVSHIEGVTGRHAVRDVGVRPDEDVDSDCILEELVEESPLRLLLVPAQRSSLGCAWDRHVRDAANDDLGLSLRQAPQLRKHIEQRLAKCGVPLAKVGIKCTDVKRIIEGHQSQPAPAADGNNLIRRDVFVAFNCSPGQVQVGEDRRRRGRVVLAHAVDVLAEPRPVAEVCDVAELKCPHVVARTREELGGCGTRKVGEEGAAPGEVRAGIQNDRVGPGPQLVDSRAPTSSASEAIAWRGAVVFARALRVILVDREDGADCERKGSWRQEGARVESLGWPTAHESNRWAGQRHTSRIAAGLRDSLRPNQIHREAFERS
eukprot:6099908-Prymnesium_polylepis.3